MRRALALALLAACTPGTAPVPKAEPPPPPRFMLGRAPADDELRDWAVGVRPDGAGLPPGRGSVTDGARLYAAKCASCHGATGVEGPSVVLVGRAPAQGYRLSPRPKDAAPVTIGNWWPRAAPLFDYLRRSQPPTAPGSLGNDELYALCAFLLQRNGIVAADAVLDRESLAKVQMPGAARFVVDEK